MNLWHNHCEYWMGAWTEFSEDIVSILCATLGQVISLWVFIVQGASIQNMQKIRLNDPHSLWIDPSCWPSHLRRLSCGWSLYPSEVWWSKYAFSICKYRVHPGQSCISLSSMHWSIDSLAQSILNGKQVGDQVPFLGCSDSPLQQVCRWDPVSWPSKKRIFGSSPWGDGTCLYWVTGFIRCHIMLRLQIQRFLVLHHVFAIVIKHVWGYCILGLHESVSVQSTCLRYTFIQHWHGKF